MFKSQKERIPTMLTGTPLDLTPFGSLLTGIGWLYWLLAASGLWWALRGERPWKAKLMRAAPIVLLFGLFSGLSAWHGLQQKLTVDSAMTLFRSAARPRGRRSSHGRQRRRCRMDEVARGDIERRQLRRSMEAQRSLWE